MFLIEVALTISLKSWAILSSTAECGVKENIEGLPRLACGSIGVFEEQGLLGVHPGPSGAAEHTKDLFHIETTLVVCENSG